MNLDKLILTALVLCGSYEAYAIVNGRDPDVIKSASSVSIFVKDNKRACTGVIISSNLILTAGHCFDRSKEHDTIQVSNAMKARGHELTLHMAKPFGRHPLYKEPSNSGIKQALDIQYDFSYIKTTENLLTTFGLTESQLPLLFSQTDQVDSALTASTAGTSYGYGYLWAPREQDLSAPPSDIKKEISVTITHNTKINTLISRSAEKSKGYCEGDSGGGLFMTGSDGRVYLAGILSGIDASKGCGSKESYGAFVIVSQHLCWLLQDSATPVPPALSTLQCN